MTISGNKGFRSKTNRQKIKCSEESTGTTITAHLYIITNNMYAEQNILFLLQKDVQAFMKKLCY